jgi:hypothetical protein
MSKTIKVPRGTARKNRRSQCCFYDVSWDGKNAIRVGRTDATKEETSRVFAPSIEAAYKKTGIELPK